MRTHLATTADLVAISGAVGVVVGAIIAFMANTQSIAMVANTVAIGCGIGMVVGAVLGLATVIVIYLRNLSQSGVIILLLVLLLFVVSASTARSIFLGI